MGLIFGICFKNGSTFQVSAARPYPNYTWVAPPPGYEARHKHWLDPNLVGHPRYRCDNIEMSLSVLKNGDPQ